jgi:hypothetical protein
MGYGYYLLPDGREAGYGVSAECDRDGCTTQIDRGLGWLCGSMPDGHRDESEPGCGRYFCGEHTADHDCPNEWGTPDHEFVPVEEHADDDECTHRSDGTDVTYCGAPRRVHAT